MRSYPLLLERTSTKVPHFCLEATTICSKHSPGLGTAFLANLAVIHGEADVRAMILANYTPSLIPGNNGIALLNASTTKLLTLYPDVPALGSPYNTGNETFGLDSNHKRAAAISALTSRSWTWAFTQRVFICSR